MTPVKYGGRADRAAARTNGSGTYQWRLRVHMTAARGVTLDQGGFVTGLTRL